LECRSILICDVSESGIQGAGWRRLMGSPKLQITLHKRATKYRSLLQKMTCKDKGSYASLPPCMSLSAILNATQSKEPLNIGHFCKRATKYGSLLQFTLSAILNATLTRHIYQHIDIWYMWRVRVAFNMALNVYMRVAFNMALNVYIQHIEFFYVECICIYILYVECICIYIL